jgi:hypothetical protein
MLLPDNRSWFPDGCWHLAILIFVIHKALSRQPNVINCCRLRVVGGTARNIGLWSVRLPISRRRVRLLARLAWVYRYFGICRLPESCNRKRCSSPGSADHELHRQMLSSRKGMRLQRG